MDEFTRHKLHSHIHLQVIHIHGLFHSDQVDINALGLNLSTSRCLRADEVIEYGMLLLRCVSPLLARFDRSRQRSNTSGVEA
jgi:hypothetical protein